MKIEFADKNRIIITGDVKSLDNYSEIRKSIQEFIDTGEKYLTVDIADSMIITSSLIGYFTKIIHADGIKLTIVVHSERLYDLLEDLNLTAMFNVKKEIG
ncbi:MAG: hypothetical protein AB7E96_09190 [Deferribacterales bacterium]